MKARDVMFVLGLFAVLALYQFGAFAPSAPDTFAQRRPFLAKLLELGKWVGIGIALRGDEQPVVEDAAPQQLYNETYPQHMVDNRPPMRAMGADGELVLDHSRGW